VPSELQISVSLYEAADGGDLARLTSMLAEHVELVHRRDDDGWTALHWAARFGREEAARLLIEHGADVNAVQEKSGETDSEDELRQKEKDGRTPLHSAVYSGNIAIVRLLLEHRSDWNLMDRYGRRPQDVTGDAAIKKLFSEEGRKITGES